MLNYNPIINNSKEWLSEDEACNILLIKPKTLKDRCRCGEYIHKIIKVGKRLTYYIHIDSLPEELKEQNLSKDQDIESESYTNAPQWAKLQADKYIRIIKESKYLKGNALERFILNWNIQNPEYKTSYPSVIKMRKRYKSDGIEGLLAR